MGFFQTVSEGHQRKIPPREVHDHASARLWGQENALNIARPENRREPRSLKSIRAIEFKSFETVSVLMCPARGTLMVAPDLGGGAPAAIIGRLRVIDQPSQRALEAGDLATLQAVGCQSRQHGIGDVANVPGDPPDGCASVCRDAGVCLKGETHRGDMHTCAPGDILLGWAFFPTQLIE